MPQVSPALKNETMKAIRLHAHGSPEVLVYEEIPIPLPGPGQVLIRVQAASVNYADTMRRRNDPYPFPSPPPFIPGGEVAGIIEAQGPGVESPPIGTLVFATTGQGGSEGYAQYVATNTAQVIPVPEGLDATRACALIISGVTAILALRDAARLQPGEAVFIQAAAGGVGSYAVQLAKLLGAGQVIAGVGSPRKLETALQLGADHAVNYSQTGWTNEVKAVTNGKGADVVLDMVGGHVSDESRTLILAAFGRMVIYGLASRESVTLDPQSLLSTNQSLLGFYLGSWFALKPQVAIDALSTLVSYVLAGHVQVQIGHVLPLKDAAEAHRMLEARQTIGKIILQPWA